MIRKGFRNVRDMSSDNVFSGMPKESKMHGKKRAVALMLAAFLLLSALPVSTMASDKAAASGSSEAAYFDRLLETAPIDEAASDTGADQEVETVLEYEKGAGDGTGALFGCETGAESESDAIYESATGAGDETGALFGCDTGEESGVANEDRSGSAEISGSDSDREDSAPGSDSAWEDSAPGSDSAWDDSAPGPDGTFENSVYGQVPAEDREPEDPAAGQEVSDESALSQEAESGAEYENTDGEEDNSDNLTGEIAEAASDSGEISGDGMQEDDSREDEAEAEDADGQEIYADQPGAEDGDGQEIYPDQPGAEDADADGTDADSINDSGLYEDENASEDDALSGTDPDDTVQTETGDEDLSVDTPAAGEGSPEQADPENTDNETAYDSLSASDEANESGTAAGDAADSSTYSEEAAADGNTYSEEAAAGSSTYSEEAAGTMETGEPAGSGPEGGQELLSDGTQTGPESEAGEKSVDEKAALTAMSLSLTDQVVMNVYVRADDSVDADDYIEFNCAGETIQQSVGDADVNRMTLADGETFEVLTFALPLRMRQMTDDVTFHMVVDGAEGTPKTRTVRSYADQILQGHFSDEQKEVTRAMLNCGSCAQEYFGYNLDRPANAGIYGPGEDPARDWEDPDLSSYDYSLHQESVLGFEFCETTLELQEDISLICYFRVGEGHFFDNITNWIYDFSLRGSDLDLTPGYDRDKGMYYVRVPHIMPYELDEMFEIEVTNRLLGYPKTVASLRYSPLTYCRDMLASDSSSPEIKNLCRSLYYYCHAANIMRGESSSVQEK